MIFQRINAEGLAASSYLIGSGREAAVIDPRRDVDVYLREAREHCLEIKYVLETHRHEDFVLGSLALKAATGASICRGDNPQVTYADRRLKDGDMLAIGGMTIKALETPGHTTDSLSYVLYESDEPEVARWFSPGMRCSPAAAAGSTCTGKAAGRSAPPRSHRSLHEKLLPPGDQALLWPAHGAGSVCGKGISDRDWTTLGYERRTNPWLSFDREAFVRKKVAEQPLYPPYFRRMERWNEAGAPPMPDTTPQPADVDAFGKAITGKDVTLVDTRMPTAFAGGHIPGSLNIFLEGMSVFPGWLVGPRKACLARDRTTGRCADGRPVPGPHRLRSSGGIPLWRLREMAK